MLILIIASFSSRALSQDSGGIRLRMNQVLINSENENVRTSDVELIVEPQAQDKSTRYSFDISYNFKRNDYYLFARVGFLNISTTRSTRKARDFNYFLSGTEVKKKSIKLSLGIFKTLKATEKLEFNYGLHNAIEVQYLNKLILSSDIYDENDIQLSSYLVDYNFTDHLFYSCGFDLGVYYYFCKNFAIGIENNYSIFYRKSDGESIETRIISDLVVNTEDLLTIYREESSHKIGTLRNYSFGLTWKF